MQPLTGIALKVLSALLFTVMSALIKLVGDIFPLGEIVFARSFFAIVPVAAMLAARRELHLAVRTTRPGSHLLRAVSGVASMFASFAALTFLPLPDVTAIGYASPLFTVVLAVLLLKERVRVYRWTAVGIGLVGVLIVLWPHLGRSGAQGHGGAGAVLALLAAAGAALAMVQVRRLTATEHTSTIVFYFSAGSACIGLATLPFGWTVPTPGQAVLLVAIGLLGGVAQLILTESYRHADASLIAPFEYTTILWATLLGYAMFGDVPSPSVALGAGIVVAAGIFVILRERQLGLERRRARRAAATMAG